MHMNNDALVEVQDLYVGYYRDLHILRGVNMRARQGTITSILGANGVGKSTLLKAIFGFLTPDHGSITFNGRNLIGIKPHKMVYEGITYIPQEPSIFDDMSVEENLEMGGWPFRNDHSRVRSKIEENYQRFPDLWEKRRQKAGELSGGQQRMVEIGRALMTDPQLMLVDEPSAGLAKLLTAEMYKLIAGLREEGKTIILVDQDIRQALGVSDYVYVLDLGHNRYDGPAKEFTDLEKTFWS